MKQTVTEYTFRKAFESLRPDNFSYEGLGLLFNMLEEYEQDTGEELELDVIAICCDFSESTIDEFFDNYDIDIGQFNDERDAIEWFLAENGGDYRWCDKPGNGWSIIYWSAF